MTLPNTRKDNTSPVIHLSEVLSLQNRSYHASSRVEYTRARRTPLGYQGDCQLEEAVVGQEGTEALASFDGHEWPRMQQDKTREQEYQELTSGKPSA